MRQLGAGSSQGGGTRLPQPRSHRALRGTHTQAPASGEASPMPTADARGVSVLPGAFPTRRPQTGEDAGILFNARAPRQPWSRDGAGGTAMRPPVPPLRDGQPRHQPGHRPRARSQPRPAERKAFQTSSPGAGSRCSLHGLGGCPANSPSSRPWSTCRGPAAPASPRHL